MTAKWNDVENRTWIAVTGVATVRANLSEDAEVDNVGLCPAMLLRRGKKIKIISASIDGEWYMDDDYWNWHFSWLKYIRLTLAKME